MTTTNTIKTTNIIRAKTIDGVSRESRDSFARAFSPFGTVIGAGESVVINDGYARKHANLAAIKAAADGETKMHLFAPKKRIPPIPITMMERHPSGAQCFVPLGGERWLALVADDDGGKPGAFRAFSVPGNCGVCYASNTWHFPLLALSSQMFAVADNGDGDDLQEYFFDDIKWLMPDNKGGKGGGGLKFANWQTSTAFNEKNFVKLCGEIAEGSPWVAQAVWQSRGTLPDKTALATAFVLAIVAADDEQQLQLIRSHPPLAATKTLSPMSAGEQKAAGLTKLRTSDKDAFAKLNGEYSDKFGFPFVCAVTGLATADILAQMQRRINNKAITERGEALYQIFQIIRNRLSRLPL